MAVQDVKGIDIIVKKIHVHQWCHGCWWCLTCRQCHCKTGLVTAPPAEGYSSWRNLSALTTRQMAGEITVIPMPGPDGQPMVKVSPKSPEAAAKVVTFTVKSISNVK